MDQDLIADDLCESGVNVDVPLRNTNNEREKSNKCNQCDYASSQAGDLKRHLKMHSGEKTNKCNQLSIKTEAEVAKPGKEVISSKTHDDLNGFFKDFVLKSEMETEATMNKN